MAATSLDVARTRLAPSGARRLLSGDPIGVDHLHNPDERTSAHRQNRELPVRAKIGRSTVRPQPLATTPTAGQTSSGLLIRLRGTPGPRRV